MKKYKIKLDGGGHSKKVIIMKNRDNMSDKREILTERQREREQYMHSCLPFSEIVCVV